MVSDEVGLRSHANMILMAGLLIGSLTLGLLSDIIGRKRTFLIALFVHIASNVGTVFASDFITFVTLRFLSGGSVIGFYMCMFVTGMELVGPSKRTIAGIVIEFFFCFGLFTLGTLAYLLRNWQHLQLAISLPSVLFFSYWWLIPESPRWLISKGRTEEAATILKKAAEMNKVDLSQNLLSLQNLENEKQEKIWNLFTSPVLLFRSSIIFFNWAVLTIVYYGLGLNVGNLGGDIYLNFTIANIVETFAFILCLQLLDRLGRRVPHCLSLVLGGLACIATIFPVLYQGNSTEWVTITLAMVGKFGASAGFGIIYLYSAELFPTRVRNSGMEASSFCARIGGMVSPYIADLGRSVEGDTSTALPLIVFGALSVAAGMLILLLPETLNRKLPETIEDAENFGRYNSENKYHLPKTGSTMPTMGPPAMYTEGDPIT